MYLFFVQQHDILFLDLGMLDLASLYNNVFIIFVLKY